MPQVIAAVVSVFAAIGTAVGASAALAAYVGAAIVIGAGVIAATALVPKLQMARQADNDRTRQSTVKSTVEPQKIIYGEALVSGPITFVGVSGNDNEIMHHVVALAGHEVNAITEIWLDDQKILQSQLNGAGW
jgi:predicted phage tail protein